MAIGTGTMLALGGGALLGGLAGSQAKKSKQSSTSSINLGAADDLELQGERISGQQLTDLEGLVGAGPGIGAVRGANEANNDLASMLQQYASGGFMPTQQDIGNANQFTQSMFAPQQMQLNQQFEDQKQQQARLAAQLGRPINDPVLQNKMMQTQAREQAMLGAQQTAFSAQQAQNMPLQRLGFQQDLAGLQSGLATQAMANRQALLNMGNTVQQQGRQFRLNTATRTNSQSTSSGGGVGGAISGALAGAGMGMQAYNSFANMRPQQPSMYGLQTGGTTGNNLFATGMVA